MYPFLLVMAKTVGSGLSDTLSYSVPRGEKLTITQLYFDSTGTFNVTDIRNAKGMSYSNALGNAAIPSTFFNDVTNQFNTLLNLVVPLELDGNDTLYIDVTDTSGGSNVIRFVANASKERVG